FSLSAALPAPQAGAIAAPSAQAVQGQQLQKVEQMDTGEKDWNWSLIVLLITCFGVFLAGIFMQNRPRAVSQQNCV
ncbi:MAG: hypothetical protein JKY34_12850, partial [Kordiimonadaceae bacterium]|nr:hypothetical protein [Kordiimonadaceae bacterium]